MYDRKPMIKSVQEFVLSCPYFKEGQAGTAGSAVMVDCSVDPVEAEKEYRRYTDGSSLRQFVFALTSKEVYGADSRDAIAETGFSQCFEEWLEEQNDKGIYPQLEGYTPLRTEMVSSGYLVSNETGIYRYQIKCRLIYR